MRTIRGSYKMAILLQTGWLLKVFYGAADNVVMADPSENESRYRALVERIPLVTYTAAPDEVSSTLYVSPQIEQLLGFPPEDFLADPELFAKRIHPEDRERVLEEIHRSHASGQPFRSEYQMLRRDGRVVWVHDEAYELYDEDGKPLGLQGVTQDITDRKEAEEKIRFQARLLDEVGEAVVAVDIDGKVVYWNRAAEELYGWSAHEAMGRPGVEVTASEELWGRADEVMSELKAMRSWAGEYQLRCKDGTLFPALINITPVHDEQGNLAGMTSVSTDITDRKRAERALRESEQRFGSAFRDAAIGMALVGLDGYFLQVNRSLCRIVGYSEEELLEKTFRDTTHPDDLQADVEQVRRMLAGEIETYQMEKRYFHKDGHVVWILLNVSLVHDEEGEPLYTVAQIQDVTERKQAEECLQYQSTHDLLTDIPNRQLFLDRLGQALRRTRRHPGHKVAVLFMDLDNFKVVNDSLGHGAGDRILVTVAERLKRCVRPEDTLARFGGDEFTVLIEDVESPAGATTVAERIIQGLREPVVLDGRELFVGTSIGIAVGTAPQKSPEDLLRDADTAMYQAKEEGLCCRVFEPDMYEQSVKRLTRENDLRRAIEAEEFVVHYQPILRLNSGEVWGLEALVRWDHPELGFLNPSRFIPAAEESGLIVPVCESVLEEACRQSRDWQKECSHVPPWHVSVNISAIQLNRPDFAEVVGGVLKRTGLEARCLSLDVTETVFVKSLESDTTALDELKSKGVRISIDDFGTGYSSLSYLKGLRADILKIDKKFIKGIGEDVEDTAIVQMVIDLAHTLGMETVAEGVESEGQAKELRRMGCDMGQGYYFSEPFPPEAVMGFLKEGLGTLGIQAP
jgi:diguanylate cyclase (GGDEF)-like protein/PAS domain S-box-containing protein